MSKLLSGSCLWGALLAAITLLLLPLASYAKVKVPADIGIELSQPTVPGEVAQVVVTVRSKVAFRDGSITLTVPNIGSSTGSDNTLWSGSGDSSFSSSYDYALPALPAGKYKFRSVFKFIQEGGSNKAVAIAKDLYLDVTEDAILSSNVSFGQIQRKKAAKELEKSGLRNKSQQELKKVAPGLSKGIQELNRVERVDEPAANDGLKKPEAKPERFKDSVPAQPGTEKELKPEPKPQATKQAPAGHLKDSVAAPYRAVDKDAKPEPKAQATKQAPAGHLKDSVAAPFRSGDKDAKPESKTQLTKQARAGHLKDSVAASIAGDKGARPESKAQATKQAPAGGAKDAVAAPIAGDMGAKSELKEQAKQKPGAERYKDSFPASSNAGNSAQPK